MSTRITAKLARQWYADELRLTAHLEARAAVDAFATVPRERFLGPGPWRVLSPMQLRSGYWLTENDDAGHVNHDVLVALDEERGTRSTASGNPRTARSCELIIMTASTATIARMISASSR
jgi:hypothetical protein